MTRQEMLHLHGEDRSEMPALTAAHQRDRENASKHIRAALAELSRVGPSCVGIGNAVMGAEQLLRSLLDEIET